MKKKSRILTSSVIILVLTMAMVIGAIPASSVSAQTGFQWLAKDGKAKVDTGLGNGTGTEGVWFVATDNPDGGKSKVIFDHADPNDTGLTISDADIKKFGGVSGTAVLDEGDLLYAPCVYIIFYIVGIKGNKPEAGDASSWGGISISYECDIAPTLELGLGDEKDKAMGYAYPAYGLSKAVAGEGVVKTVAWDQFSQPGWIGSYALKVTGEEAAKELVAFRFRIQGNPGEYHFRIAGIGSADATLPKPADPSTAGHWLTPVPAKAATCLEDGNIAYYKCDDCGKLFKDSEGIIEITAAETKAAATGHNWNEWVVVKEATETSTGTRIRICKNDPSHIESENIPVLGMSNLGWQAISDDGKKLTDADGQEYMVADKSDPNKLKKDDQVADEKTGGKYKIASVTTKNGKVSGGTVIFQNPYNPTAKTVDVKDTVTISGVKFKISEISAKAYMGNKNITKITIGKNVKKIGASAFDGCSKLKSITIKTTKLTKKSVGKNAFRGIHKKAKAKVPGKKLKSYKSILKAKGMKGKKQKITK